MSLRTGRRLVPFSFDASGKSDSSGRDEEDEGGQLPIHMAPGAALDMVEKFLVHMAKGLVSLFAHSSHSVRWSSNSGAKQRKHTEKCQYSSILIHWPPRR